MDIDAKNLFDGVDFQEKADKLSEIDNEEDLLDMLIKMGGTGDNLKDAAFLSIAANGIIQSDPLNKKRVLALLSISQDCFRGNMRYLSSVWSELPEE